jgi:transcription termination/antitermination protein NusG
VSEKGGALSTPFPDASLGYSFPTGVTAEEPSFWFAIQTKARHEKKVHSGLREKGIHSFLPIRRERRRWSDRSQWVELPMFSQYVFARVSGNGDSRIRVLQTNGVVQFVGASGRGTPIPDEQIESLVAIVSQCIPTAPHEFLRVGQRVRIRGGALEGIEGILSAIRNEKNLIVSVELIQKSVTIRIDGFDVEPA